MIVSKFEKNKKMDLEARKILFVQEFLRIKNEDLIKGLESLMRKGKTSIIENEMKPMSIAQLHEDINQSLIDSENGNLIKATDLKAKIDQWS